MKTPPPSLHLLKSLQIKISTFFHVQSDNSMTFATLRSRVKSYSFNSVPTLFFSRPVAGNICWFSVVIWPEKFKTHASAKQR